jgi:hypothetical protein
MFNKFFFLESSAICEILWENDKAGQPTGGNMAHAYWMLVPKAKDTYADYVILIALPL